MLHEGRAIGPAEPPYEVSAETDRPLGRFTVSYDDEVPPLDLYAHKR
jgi:hypothetical protein